MSRPAVPGRPRAAHCTRRDPPVSHAGLTEGELCPSALTWLWACTGNGLKPWCFQTLNSTDLFDQNAQIGGGSMTKFQRENQVQRREERSLALCSDMFTTVPLFYLDRHTPDLFFFFRFVHVATIKHQMLQLEMIPIHWYAVCLGNNAGHFNEEEWPQFSEM